MHHERGYDPGLLYVPTVRSTPRSNSPCHLFLLNSTYLAQIDLLSLQPYPRPPQHPGSYGESGAQGLADGGTVVGRSVLRVRLVPRTVEGCVVRDDLDP